MSISRVFAVVCATTAMAPAAFATNAKSQYYGNVAATGQSGCSAIQGNFPAVVGYQYAAGGNSLSPSLVVLKILIQGTNLTPQWIVDYLTPNSSGNGGTVNTQDPLLFGGSTTLSGVNGTYTGTAVPDQQVGAYFNVNVTLTSTFNGITCILPIAGVLYFTP